MSTSFLRHGGTPLISVRLALLTARTLPHTGPLEAVLSHPSFGIEYRDAGGNCKPHRGPSTVCDPAESFGFVLSAAHRGQRLAASA